MYVRVSFRSGCYCDDQRQCTAARFLRRKPPQLSNMFGISLTSAHRLNAQRSLGKQDNSVVELGTAQVLDRIKLPVPRNSELVSSVGQFEVADAVSAPLTPNLMAV